MKILQFIVFLGVIVMCGALAYGFLVGNFFMEGKVLVSIPWGIVTLIDIYLMFFIFCGWVWFREDSKLLALLISLSVLVFGAFSALLYMFWVSLKSNNNWNKFWLGLNLDQKPDL